MTEHDRAPVLDMAQAPPHSLEAEQSAIGAMLLSPGAMVRALVIDEGLRPEHFYRARHAKIYEAILALHDQGEPIDVLTVVEQLNRTGQLEEIGGQATVDALTGAVPAAGNARAYARIIKEHAARRDIALAAYELLRGVYGPDDEALKRGERMLAQRGNRHRDEFVDGHQMRELVYEHLQGDTPDGFPFPWTKLNELLSGSRQVGGMRRGESTAIGGWTNHGKTPFIDQILDHVGRRGHTAILYSNEGVRKQRALRNLARDATINLTRLKARDLNDVEMKRALDACEQPLAFGLQPIDDWTAEEIARDLRWRKPDIAAIDMLHYIPHSHQDERAGVEHNLAVLITAGILADCHLILAVHLNEERAKGPIAPPPVLRDIRQSGMIKNRVSQVLFVHREQEVVNGMPELLDDASAYFAKIRDGEYGGVKLTFEGRFQRFMTRESA